MPKEKLIEQEGTVIESLPNVMFRVQLDINDMVILCHACGKMRQNYVKVIPGDRVKVEITPYDPMKGRIVKRY